MISTKQAGHLLAALEDAELAAKLDRIDVTRRPLASPMILALDDCA